MRSLDNPETIREDLVANAIEKIRISLDVIRLICGKERTAEIDAALQKFEETM